MTSPSSSVTARAVLTDGAGAFSLAEVILAPPVAGEVLVRIMAAGVCHTDLDSLSWRHRMSEAVMIVGHEGAGIVEAVGPDVREVAPGDSVLLNWAIPCGTCFQCSRGADSLCETRPSVAAPRRLYAGRPAEASFGLGTMATHALVPQQAVVRIPAAVPHPIAAVMGCGVMTGFGSVVNAARVEAGSSVVVLGTGGVGLSVILGAVHAGAGRIIAVDVSTDRLDLAISFGATDRLLADRADRGLLDAAREVRRLTGRGADYAFECTAVPSLGAAPLAMVRNGGTAIAVSGIEEVVPIDMELFEWDKRYLNPLYGQCRPARDFPLLCSLYLDGRLPLDALVTRTYPLGGIGQAFEDMRQGRSGKGVLLPHG
jgi:S-(hydroxymethyl)glutathione dehydrogenase / alcohol dehydrogenase